MSRRGVHKQCEGCGSQRELTKHHVYPRYLRDIWEHQLKQVMAILCRDCHDVVHLRGGLRAARRCKSRVSYIRRFCDPKIQAVLGPYRQIIRALERESRALHVGEVFDEQRLVLDLRATGHSYGASTSQGLGG